VKGVIMKIRIFLLLGIISMALFISCESDWYPIYEDWLCTINIDGTNLEYIRNSYGNFLLSPDRQTLIEYTKNKFYDVDLNDLSSKILLYDFGDDYDEIYNPSISNTHIAFTHNADIYSLNIETKDTTRLTFDGVLEINPAFSSDGTKIVYTTFHSADSVTKTIVMNSDGSNKNVILEEIHKRYNKFFHFINSDISIIYYILFKSGIYTINIDGSNHQCILENVHPYYLTLSPNRDYVIFMSDGYLQKINVDGTGHTLLTDTNNWEFDAVISPNGQKILYSKEDFPYIMDADGTGSYKLIDKMIADKDSEYRESYFLNDNKILLTLKKQIN